MLIPYRAKNPPDSYPYCTIGLIVANFIIYFATTSHLVVTDWAIAHLAVSHNTLSLWRLITAIFLHENLLHIAGNMLFLWIFGAAVEGRLKHWKFLTIYFAAGILGGLLSDLIFGVHEPDIPSLGASGAIMGVLGAYLYMFPHSYISSWFLLRLGPVHWPAMWFMVFYIGWDIFNGYMSGFQDGVGHVAHLSGFALGYIGALAFRPHIDSSRSSQVKSTLADLKEVELLTLNELSVLIRQPNVTPQILTAYFNRCRHEGDDRWQELLSSAMRRYSAMTIDECDPTIVAKHIMTIDPQMTPFSAIALLRLGTRLEHTRDTDTACLIYRRIYDLNSDTRDAETALFRLGRLLDRVYQNPQAALETYREMLRRFPAGALALDGQDAITRLSAGATAAPSPAAYRHQAAEEQALTVEHEVQAVQGTNMGSGRMLEL